MAVSIFKTIGFVLFCLIISCAGTRAVVMKDGSLYIEIYNFMSQSKDKMMERLEVAAKQLGCHKVEIVGGITGHNLVAKCIK